MNNSKGIQKKHWALAVALMTGFAAPLMTSSLNLSVYDISSYFGCGATTVTWVINVYTLATAIFSIPLGHLADLKGRRKLIMIGSLLYGISALACIFAPGIAVLIALRLCMGISAGLFVGASTPLVLTYYPPEQKGRMLGITVTAVYLGHSAGPVIGGIINSAFGWRGIFVLPVLLALLSSFIAWKMLDADQLPAEKPKMDVAGNILIVLTLFALMFGMSEMNSQSWAKWLVIAGVPLLAAFILCELRAQEPVMQVRLFASSPSYSLSNLAAACSFAAAYAITYCIAVYLQNVQGFSSATAGLVLLVMPGIQALISPIAGRLSDRFEPSRIAAIGMTCIAAGVGLLSLVRFTNALPLVFAGLLLTGLGNAIFGSPNTNTVLSCVDKDHLSEAQATVSSMRGIGQSVSVVVISVVLSATIGDTVFAEAASSELSHAVGAIMGTCSLFGVAGIFCCLGSSFFARKNRRK